jgi:hypothetical protein
MEKRQRGNQGQTSHLAPGAWTSELGGMDTIDPEDVRAIMFGVWDANRKLDDIVSYLLDDDDGEEEETDLDG